MITIPRRFRGTPNSGQGGYVCGMLARHIDDAAEIIADVFQINLLSDAFIAADLPLA